jgi:hypothetical protein
MDTFTLLYQPHIQYFVDTKERGEKICCPTFFCNQKYKKIKTILMLLAKKKIWANLQRITEIFTQKVVIKLSKI